MSNTAKQEIKKFTGNRPLEEIRKACLAKGWTWDQSRYDRGSDYVTFYFGKREVIFNTFNGGFMVKAKKSDKAKSEFITEQSTEMDGTKWYDELLDFIYTSAPKAKGSK